VAFASLRMLSKNIEPHPFYLALWANFYWPSWFKICCVVCWWRCSYDFKYIILHSIIFNQPALITNQYLWYLGAWYYKIWDFQKEL
jgi:hypothetical protein